MPNPALPRLFVSHDRALRRLVAVEYGRVVEDQPAELVRPVGDDLTLLLDAPEGRIVGCAIDALDDFDVDAPTVARIWDDPRFAVPVLGLTAATIGELVLAARRHFRGRNSVDRTLAVQATAAVGREAVVRWTLCLEAGDATAHHHLGRTLLELDRPAEAYAHLRHYTELAPAGAWNWNLYGRAAEAIGEREEARCAYRRAIALAPADGHAGRTDAEGRLAALGG